MTPEEMEKFNVPSELRGEAMFKDIPDLPTLFKVARDTKAALGNAIRVPGPEAADKDRAEFHEKLKKHAPTLIEIPKEEDKREAALLSHLGLPAEPKGYAPPQEHGLPNDVIERLQMEAKEEGLTKRQFEARVLRTKSNIEKEQKAHAEGIAALKKDLGPAFEDRLSLAAAVAQKHGATDAEVKAIKEGRAPVQSIRTFLAVAKTLGSEPGDLGDFSGGGTKTITPAEARSRIQEIYTNPAFQDKAHPQYRDLQEKLLYYNRILYPEET